MFHIYIYIYIYIYINEWHTHTIAAIYVFHITSSYCSPPYKEHNIHPPYKEHHINPLHKEQRRPFVFLVL